MFAVWCLLLLMWLVLVLCDGVVMCLRLLSFVAVAVVVACCCCCYSSLLLALRVAVVVSLSRFVVG